MTIVNHIRNHEAEDERDEKDEKGGKDAAEDVDGILMSTLLFHNHQHSQCVGMNWHIKDSWQYTAPSQSPTGHSEVSSLLVTHMQHERQQELHHLQSLRHAQR